MKKSLRKLSMRSEVIRLLKPSKIHLAVGAFIAETPREGCNVTIPEGGCDTGTSGCHPGTGCD